MTLWIRETCRKVRVGGDMKKQVCLEERASSLMRRELGTSMRLRPFPEWPKVIRASGQRSRDQTRLNQSLRSAHCPVTASQGSRRKHSRVVDRKHVAQGQGAVQLTPADLPAQ